MDQEASFTTTNRTGCSVFQTACVRLRVRLSNELDLSLGLITSPESNTAATPSPRPVRRETRVLTLNNHAGMIKSQTLRVNTAGRSVRKYGVGIQVNAQRCKILKLS